MTTLAARGIDPPRHREDLPPVLGVAYQRDPASRGPGFMVGALAFGALGLASGVGVALRLFG